MSHKTHAQYAREAAEAFIEEAPGEAAPGYLTLKFKGTDVTCWYSCDALLMAHRRSEMCRAIAELVESQRAMAEQETKSAPLPCPMTDEEMTVARTFWTVAGGSITERLLRQVDFLAGVLRDCSADGLLAVRQAGYASGLVAGRREGSDIARRDLAEMIRERLLSDVVVDGTTAREYALMVAVADGIYGNQAGDDPLRFEDRIEQVLRDFPREGT